MKKQQKLLFAGVCFVAFVLILSPVTPREGARQALVLCGETLIPNIFPFMVLGNMLTLCGGGEILGRLFSPLVRRVLKMSGACALPVITGFISGVPVGACVTAEMVKRGEITREEGEKLLCLCNNPGPVFMLSAATFMVGCEKEKGVILWISVVVSSFIAMLFIKGKTDILPCHKRETELKPITQCIVEAVKKAVVSVIYVCGFVIFFGVLVSIVPEGIGRVKSAVAMFSEMTVGCSKLGEIPMPENLKLVFSSMVLAWSGISAHAQVAASVQGSGMKLKNYFLGKLLQTVISPAVTIVLIKLLPGTVQISVTKSNPAVINIILSFMMLIFIVVSMLFLVSAFSGNKKQVKR